MTNNEVNKVIAEYMGEEYCKLPDNRSAIKFKIGNSQSVLKENYYSNSLDALVPVWEKARISNVCQFDFNRIGDNYEFLIFQDRPDKDYGNSWHAKEHTLQQAAAHATAKAIKDLT